MRKSLLMQAAVVLASLGIAAAHASTISAGNYDLTDVTAGGFELTGSVTLNSSGIVNAANITVQDAAANDPVFTDVIVAGGPWGYSPAANYAYIVDPGVGELWLSYLTSLDGSGNVDLCILNANDCNNYEASYLHIDGRPSFGYEVTGLGSGSLDPETSTSSLTPEPATLALVGTSLIALVKMNRPRSRRRRL